MRVTFSRFVFDSERRELLGDGGPIHLPPKAFQLLELLIAASPRALTKKELLDAVWPDTFVEESNLAGLVNDVRAALGDTPRNSTFVRTVHGYGYAFCGAASPVTDPPSVGTVAFRGESFPLRDGPNVLGRDPAADIQIDDPTVSRRHARIVIAAGGAAVLEDLRSKNGTFLDGREISAPVELVEGSKITLGDAEIVFRRGVGSTTITRISVR